MINHFYVDSVIAIYLIFICFFLLPIATIAYIIFVFAYFIDFDEKNGEFYIRNLAKIIWIFSFVPFFVFILIFLSGYAGDIFIYDMVDDNNNYKHNYIQIFVVPFLIAIIIFFVGLVQAIKGNAHSIWVKYGNRFIVLLFTLIEVLYLSSLWQIIK